METRLESSAFKLILISILLIFSFELFAANFESKNQQDIQWADGSTWVGGVSPGNSVFKEMQIEIHGRVIADYETLFMAKEGSLVIKNGATLVVTGVLASDKEYSITVEEGASLVIFGNYSSAKELHINNNGTVLFIGDVTAAKEAEIDTDNPGAELYVLGDLSLNSPTSFDHIAGESYFEKDTVALFEKQPDLMDYLLSNFEILQSIFSDYMEIDEPSIVYAIANGDWSDETFVWSKDGSNACECKPSGTDSVIVNGFNVMVNELVTIADLVVDNSSNINLVADGIDNNLVITNSLTLTNGYVITNSNNLLVLAEGVTIIGGSDNSFVHGPMQRTTSTVGEIIFPVGDDGVFAPLGIELESSTTSTYTAEYSATPYSDVESIESGSGIVNVSGVEYWDLAKNSGVDVFVTMYYLDLERSTIKDISKIVLAHWTGIEWENIGCTAFTENAVRSGLMTSFSPITGGGSDGGALPVELVGFYAIFLDNYVRLEWTTASEKNNDFFTVERSVDGIHFEEVTIVDGTGNSSVMIEYSAKDENPLLGEVYYRLKQTDYDGTYTYSRVESVTYNVDFAIIEETFVVYPNPLSEGDDIKLRLITSEDIEIEIINIKGARVFYDEYKLEGAEELEVDVEILMGFPSGNYLVRVSSEDVTVFENVIVK